jgi:catalase
MRSSALRTRVFTPASAVLAVCFLASPAVAQEADAQAIVDGQFAVGGNHPKVRASGAKGTCVKGTFTPSAEAPSLSKAPQFTKPVAVTAASRWAGATRIYRTRRNP